ncbi:hypothetical protein SBF1_5150005 [Candidatus Desulfosporosinus infrequens]|uniref:Uncharacterized protein n=1 Tax=Candidatus Desulfosporosinus infrequens TaxID=2043169 RepID=A0A2U3LI59_9FIRM|nr:hypothetical protein SBF1_5150005 [Candidatus Desulfosporosinus infrequens]
MTVWNIGRGNIGRRKLSGIDKEKLRRRRIAEGVCSVCGSDLLRANQITDNS